MAEIYSSLKPLRYLDRLQSLKRGWPCWPVHVQLILTNKCNHRCTHCAYRDKSYTTGKHFDERAELDHDKAIEIIEDCKLMGVEAIQFTGGGEPTLHPHFAEILGHAQQSGIKTAVVTNGSLIIARQLVPLLARCSWVRMSIDAGNESQYATIRQIAPNKMSDVREGIIVLRSAIDAAGSDCVVGVGCVITPDNYTDIIAAAQNAKQWGAHNIRYSAQFSAAGASLYDGIREEIERQLAVTRTMVTRDQFAVVDRFSERIDDMVGGTPDYRRCGYQSLTTYIGADANVYRCCNTANTPHGLIGSIADQRLKTLWHEAAQRIQKFTPARCERCQFNGINRMLDYALQADKPMHCEFV